MKTPFKETMTEDDVKTTIFKIADNAGVKYNGNI